MALTPFVYPAAPTPTPSVVKNNQGSVSVEFSTANVSLNNGGVFQLLPISSGNYIEVSDGTAGASCTLFLDSNANGIPVYPGSRYRVKFTSAYITFNAQPSASLTFLSSNNPNFGAN